MQQGLRPCFWQGSEVKGMSDHIDYLQNLVNALQQQRASHDASVKTVAERAKELLKGTTTPASETEQPSPKK